MSLERLPEGQTEDPRLYEIEHVLSSYQESHAPLYERGAEERGAQEQVRQAIEARPDLQEALATTDKETYDQLLGLFEEESEYRKLESLEQQSYITPEFWKKAQPVLEAVVATLKIVGLIGAAIVVPGVGFEPLAIAAFLEQAIKIKEIYHVLRKLWEGAVTRERTEQQAAV